MPPGWSWDNANNPLLVPGHDWSFVLVENPELDFEGSVLVEPISFPVRIVGSGTVKTMAVDPTRPYLYALASDQGQELVAENATLLDGGFHVPHLYVLDLWSGDLTDQAWINGHLSSVVTQRYRLNKVVYAEFEEYTAGEPDVWGATCVNSTIPGFPLSGGGATGPTRVSGASLASIGSYDPGEYQLDPTARVAMKCVDNPFMTEHPARLYIGTTGKRQGSTTTAVGTLENGQAFLTPQVGALIVLSLGDPEDQGYDGIPTYLRTVTLPQVYPPDDNVYNPYTVAGLDVVRPDRNWIEDLDTAPRNVLLVNAANTRAIDDPVIATDRIVVVQDP